MSDIVYSVGNIFSNDKRDGALGQLDAEKYYVAPYQRGYKWASDDPNSPVWLLMTDIMDAFTGNESEYYLQYITIKKSVQNGRNVLEVIDGQQRLTTLTLLFSILAFRMNNKDMAITNNKLSYKVRAKVSEFFKRYVYNGIEELIGKSWSEFITDNPEYDEQDIYFLLQAINRIDTELPKDRIDAFAVYMRDNVQIILNNIDRGNITSERIFSNLNTNKVDLTSAELVKGLLLTKAARERKNDGDQPHFKEILEGRATIGRQWDEITNWAASNEIRIFYFKEFEEPIEGLLLLVALKKGYTLDSKRHNKYELFNYFQTLIKRKNITASSLFNEIRETFQILKEWHNRKDIHNLLGFLFFHEKSKFSLSKNTNLLLKSKDELIKTLTKFTLDLFPEDINELEYGKDNTLIHLLLLAISVFGSEQAFNFEAFADDKWSLEHIFPQNPDELNDELKSQDISLIKSLLKPNWKKNGIEHIPSLFEEIEAPKEFMDELDARLKGTSCKLEKKEKTLLYQLMKTDKLNSLGNMALLSSGINSSLSNGMFDAKRLTIVEKVSNGQFVPKHTYDVFSKLLSDSFNPNLTVWSEHDIEVHEEWIKKRIGEIKSSISNG